MAGLWYWGLGMKVRQLAGWMGTEAGLCSEGNGRPERVVARGLLVW
jgi:hypothetical protein